MAAFKRNILITGGAGFIGNHVVRLFVNKYPDYRIINLDKLTYAGNLANVSDVACRGNYVFAKCDICDAAAVVELFARYDIDGVIHLAAESHVDRSIHDPMAFARTNVLGTLTLLQAALEHWRGGDMSGKRFVVVSTCGYAQTDLIYDSLLSQLDCICGKENYYALLCPQGKLLSIPELWERMETYLEKYKAAGAELGKTGELSDETVKNLRVAPLDERKFKILLEMFWRNEKSGKNV